MGGGLFSFRRGEGVSGTFFQGAYEDCDFLKLTVVS